VQSHRSKHAPAVLAVALAAACNRDPQVTTRTVTLHAPKACPVSGSAFVQYFEQGDFEPTSPTGGHLADQNGAVLTEIDPAARSLVVEVTESSSTWSGVAAVPASGDVDALVLASLTPCALSPIASSQGSRSGALVAALSGDLALVVGGGTPTMHPATYVADLSTGTLSPLSGPDLGGSRTGATLTSFGTGALVAGGIEKATNAEKYSSAAGFDQQHPIMLSEARADQGAVVLAAGQTLLVSGVGADGVTLLATMDRVDPATDTAQEQNVAVLAVPRRSPQVLRLASGEILVAGGFDAAGAAVPAVEWFSADASHATRSESDLVAGVARAFVALEAGGALAVVVPPAGSAPDFPNVWVIGAAGAFDAATPLPGVTAPILFGGAGGAPVLWTGDRWLRWQPWQGTFESLGVPDTAPSNPSTSAASPDPGLAVWLDAASSAFTALRFDTRGMYSPLAGPLLVGDTRDMAPDRLAASGVAAFDPSTGLVLGPGASAFVTDRAYASVSIDVDAPTGEPALVVLRDELGVELELGGLGCPLTLARAGARSSLHVQRRASSVTWSIAGGGAGTCPTGVRSDARLSIGVRAPGSVSRSVTRNLRVTRLMGPTP
jgi:hypothetical protein